MLKMLNTKSNRDRKRGGGVQSPAHGVPTMGKGEKRMVKIKKLCNRCTSNGSCDRQNYADSNNIPVVWCNKATILRSFDDGDVEIMLHAAAEAFSDAEMFDRVAELLDISDGELVRIRDELHKYLRG